MARYKHITMVELSTGQRYTREAVIDYIAQGYEFITSVNGNTARVLVRTCPRCFTGNYLTTSADRTTANNLDDLPEF